MLLRLAGDAAGLHIVPLFLLYLTPLYAAAMSSAAGHMVMTLHFGLAGCLYAWAIAGPDPMRRRPSVPLPAVVLVLSAGLHAWLAKLVYARAETLHAAVMHTPEDLRGAAVLMYYGGDGAELMLAVALFAGWSRDRVRRHRRDAARRAAPLRRVQSAQALPAGPRR